MCANSVVAMGLLLLGYPWMQLVAVVGHHTMEVGHPIITGLLRDTMTTRLQQATAVTPLAAVRFRAGNRRRRWCSGSQAAIRIRSESRSSSMFKAPWLRKKSLGVKKNLTSKTLHYRPNRR